MTTMREPGRWQLSELKQFIDDGDGPIADELNKIVKILEEEKNSNFILGKIIIENDMIEDDDDEEDDNDE
jgi:hypothetical protein